MVSTYEQGVIEWPCMLHLGPFNVAYEIAWLLVDNGITVKNTLRL